MRERTEISSVQELVIHEHNNDGHQRTHRTLLEIKICGKMDTPGSTHREIPSLWAHFGSCVGSTC